MGHAQANPATDLVQCPPFLHPRVQPSVLRGILLACCWRGDWIELMGSDVTEVTRSPCAAAWCPEIKRDIIGAVSRPRRSIVWLNPKVINNLSFTSFVHPFTLKKVCQEEGVARNTISLITSVHLKRWYQINNIPHLFLSKLSKENKWMLLFRKINILECREVKTKW